MILSSTISDSTCWYIYETAEHTLLFEPITAPGRVLYSPDTYFGTELQLTWASLTNSFRQWWIGGYNSFESPYLPSRTFALQCTGELATNSTWYPLIQKAVAAWNNSDAGVNIVLTNDTSKYTLNVVEKQAQYAGDTLVYEKEGYPGIVESAEIIIGAQHLTNATDQHITSVITHEIGHLLGLDDYDSDDDKALLVNNSIMSYGRNYETVTTPQDFDVRNVLFQYE